MFLSPCLLAVALLQSAPPPAEPESELPKAFANLDTMRRMLVRKVAENSKEIGPKSPSNVSEMTDTDGDGFPDTESRTGKVATDFLRATRDLYGESAIASHGDYVPGLAAIFGLTVPVRIETTRAKAGAEPETAKRHDADDADWDEIAKGDGNSAAWRAYQDMFQRGDVVAAVQTYSPEAIAALRRTVTDTIWRFGHKLELGRGERLAVVVSIQPANAWNLSWPQTRGGTAANATYNQALQSLQRGGATEEGTMTWIQPPPQQRLVFQVTGDDLRAFKEGDLERDELAKRTRIQAYTLPADEAARSFLNSYGSGSSAAR